MFDKIISWIWEGVKFVFFAVVWIIFSAIGYVAGWAEDVAKSLAQLAKRSAGIP